MLFSLLKHKMKIASLKLIAPLMKMPPFIGITEEIIYSTKAMLHFSDDTFPPVLVL